MTMRSYHRQKFAKEIILSKHQPPGPFPLVLVLDHMKPTFNIGKIIRTANALGVREVHLVGIPVFSPKPCKGTLRRTRTQPFDTFADSYARLAEEDYALFALAPQGEETLGAVELPPRSAFIVGHEEYGLSFDPKAYARVRRLRIPQFGAVQSLNASIAAAIACFEYLRQRNFSVPT